MSRYVLFGGFSLIPLLGILLLSWLGFPARSNTVLPDALPQPDPTLTPTQVVRLQLDALQHNDQLAPDGGVQISWNFASPGNKQAMGPLNRFARRFHQGHYESLVDHQAYRFVHVQFPNQHFAVIEVALYTASGIPVHYRFQLSRQTEEALQGCWMTDAVGLLRRTSI